MKKRNWILVLISIFCIGIATAQQFSDNSKSELPEGPLIQKRAPDFSCWVITLKNSAATTTGVADPSANQPKSSEALSEVSFTKTKDIMQVQLIRGQQPGWSVWFQGNLQVAVSPDKKTIGFSAKTTSNVDYNPLYFNLEGSDFEGFGWIGPDNFLGIKKYGGKRCLIFKKTIALPELNSSSTMTAAVDFETRLPVTLISENGIASYRFLTPPTAALELPTVVQSFIQEERRKMQALQRKPSKPY